MKVSLTAVMIGLLAAAGRADSLLKPNDRIIFVGDSITAQSVGGLRGYYHQFTSALQTVYPTYKNEVIALGFSGNTLFDWKDTLEVKSRTQSVPANCGGFDVHTAFAKHGDLVLILLGMNDILKPTMRDDEAVLQTWKAKYRELIAAIARGMVEALQDGKLSAAFNARIDAEIAKLQPAKPMVTYWFRPQPGCAADRAEQT